MSRPSSSSTSHHHEKGPGEMREKALGVASELKHNFILVSYFSSASSSVISFFMSPFELNLREIDFVLYLCNKAFGLSPKPLNICPKSFLLTTYLHTVSVTGEEMPYPCSRSSQIKIMLRI